MSDDHRDRPSLDRVGETSCDQHRVASSTKVSNSRVQHSRDDGVANAAIAEAADRLERLQAALIEIRDSRFCSYENSGSGQYGIGVADGHRYCANVARTAIG